MIGIILMYLFLLVVWLIVISINLIKFENDLLSYRFELERDFAYLQRTIELEILSKELEEVDD